MGDEDSLAALRREGLVTSFMAAVILLVLQLSSLAETHSTGDPNSYGTLVAASMPEGWLGVLSSGPVAWLFLAGWAFGFTTILLVFARRRRLRESAREDLPLGKRHFSRDNRSRHLHRKLLAVAMTCLVVGGTFTFFIIVPATITGQGQSNKGGVDLPHHA